MFPKRKKEKFFIQLVVVSLIATHFFVGNYSFGLSNSNKAQSQFGAFQIAASAVIDPSGNIFVVDQEANELLKFSSTGALLHRIGGYGWTQNTFDHPSDVSCPNGIDVYVADYGNHRIQRFDRRLNYVSSFNLRSDDLVTFRFGYPLSIDVDRFGSLYILEGENKQILKINNRQLIERIFGGIEAGKGRLVNPKKIRVSADDKVYVHDANGLKVFDIFGNFLKEYSKGFFTDLTTFSLSRDTVFVLDDCIIKKIASGISVQLGAMPQTDTFNICEAKDFIVRRNKIFVLTEKRITIINIQNLIQK